MDIAQIPDDQLQAMLKPQNTDLSQLSDAQLAALASNVVQSPNGLDNSTPVSQLPWYAQQAGLASRALMEGLPLPGEILANVTARPIMNAINSATGNPYRVPDQTQTGTQAADELGLATPQNAGQRIELAAGRAIASVPAFGGVGSAVADAASLAPDAAPLVGSLATKIAQGLKNIPAYSADTAEYIGNMLKSDIPSQMQSAAGAAGASQAVKEWGANQAVQLGAGLIGGGAVPLITNAPKAIPAIWNAGDTLLQPFTQEGKNKIIANALSDMASNPGQAMENLADVPQYVPGSIPQSGVASGDIGLMGAQRALGSNPIAGPIISQAAQAQNAARNSYFQPLAGNAADITAATNARGAATGPLYESAQSEMLNPQPLQPILDKIDAAVQNVGTETQAGKTLLGIKSQIQGTMPSQGSELTGLLDESGDPIMRPTSDNVTQGGMTQLYRELRDKLSKTAELDGAYPAAVRGVLQPIVRDFGSALESQSPTLTQANQTFRQMSQPINQMQTMQDIGTRAAGNQPDIQGLPAFEQNRFANALKMNSEEIPNLTQEQQVALQNMNSDLTRSNMVNAPFVKINGSPTAYNISIGKALGRSLGVDGVGGIIRGPLDMIYRSPENEMQAQIGQAFADPDKMRSLLAQSTPAQQKNIVQMLGNSLKNYGAGTAIGINSTGEN